MTLEGKYDQAFVIIDGNKVKVLPLPDHKRGFKERDSDYAEDVSISHNTKTGIVEISFVFTTDVDMVLHSISVENLEHRPYDRYIKSKWQKKYFLFGPKVFVEKVKEGAYYYPSYRERRIRTYVSNVNVSFMYNF